MSTVCTNCGEPITEIRKFCENCGAKIETENISTPKEPVPEPPAQEEPPARIQSQQSAPPIQLQLEQFEQAEESPPPKEPAPAPPAAPVYSGGNTPYVQSAPADARPPKGSKYAPVGTLAYMGLMILMNIPLIGFIASIILTFSKKNINRRNFGRAVFVFNIIGLVIAAACAVFVGIIWVQINEFLIQQGVNIDFWF